VDGPIALAASAREREVFTISRELEYFSEAELTTQTGYGREAWWPRVIVKETIDNALDTSETDLERVWQKRSRISDVFEHGVYV
jgi:hypothetical protein